MIIYTIGFTKKNAKTFFEILDKNNISRIIDVRLNNTSQLAGFIKRDDFKYFLSALCNIDYYHAAILAPTKESRDRYNKGKDWNQYVKDYIKILEYRKVLDVLDKSLFEKNACILCSEVIPDYCHRRLLAEYLKKHWGDVKVIHL
ncbi:MAG: DUF488 domain-containing protein [Methanosarcinaceae archaeon]|nr:DUF488 domain-containing protein [Methanosarcinaceae archaeon]NKQ38636.1 DUF488 domain-containing protein [Methanosarcinales archaeon]